MVALVKNSMVPLFAIFGIFALGACSTVEGFGKDVESAGNAIEETAKDAKD